MPSLIVQMGHCYRRSGATGTDGEQTYATLVADAARRLLHGRGGWSVRTTLADVDDYRADAFVAIHCDGSTSSSARGASAGYQTPEGQAFAHAWQRAYAARGWPIFRPDNYTASLAGYYGVRHAVSAGTRRAFIAECGFLTSPADRELLRADGGPERVALAIGDALGIPHGQEIDMPLTSADTNAVWMQPCVMTYEDGTTETHPAAEWLTVMAVRVGGLVGSVSGLAQVVAELSTNSDLTADQVREIIAEEIRRNMRITGTVEITGDAQ